MSFYLAAFMTKKYQINKMKSSLPGILPDQAAVSFPIARQRAVGKRAAFCAAKQKASFTVEAALILPLFLLAVLALFNMLEVFGVYLRESVELKEQAEKAAMYAFDNREEQDEIGMFGSGYITLTKLVSYKVRYAPFPLPAFAIPCRARVHAWTGYDEDQEADQAQENTELVFVSQYESVYHTSASCSHLKLQIYQKSLSEAKTKKNAGGARYQPCERCIGDGGSHSVVYLSEYGRAYHNSLACSGLKRSVRLVKKSEVADLSCCSRCLKRRSEHE